MTVEEAEAAIGERVHYTGSNREMEYGVITSTNDRFVFVRYGTHKCSMATIPADLEFE